MNETSASTYFHPYQNNHSNKPNNEPQKEQKQQHHSRSYNNKNNSATYRWTMSEWSECDKYCDGKRFQTAACLYVPTNTKVSQEYCQDLQPKPDNKFGVCNMDCEIMYVV